MVKVYDLAVIGGGYWGAAIAYEAQKVYGNVIVIDDKDPMAGSRAASGIADRAAFKSSTFKRYLPADWTNQDLDESFSWLLCNGGVLTQERFRNDFLKTPSREGASCVHIPNVYTIMGLADDCFRLSAKVQRGDILRSTVELVLKLEDSPPPIISAKRVVVAAGYQSGRVLSSLGIHGWMVAALYGRGILATGTPREAIPLSVMIKPYVKHTVRAWDGGTGDVLYKVGDTAEEVKKESKLEALRVVGRSVLDNYKEVYISEGYRPVMEKFTVAKVNDKVVLASGGHRLGLGLAGLVAKKTLEAFK